MFIFAMAGRWQMHIAKNSFMLIMIELKCNYILQSYGGSNASDKHPPRRIWITSIYPKPHQTPKREPRALHWNDPKDQPILQILSHMADL